MCIEGLSTLVRIWKAYESKKLEKGETNYEFGWISGKDILNNKFTKSMASNCVD